MDRLWTIGGLLVVAVLWVGCSKGEREVPAPPATTCGENLRVIVAAGLQWAADAGMQGEAETRTPDLADLIAMQYLPAHMVKCPHSAEAQREMDYAYVYIDPDSPEAAPDMAVACCLGRSHPGQGNRMIARLDGTVEQLTAEEFDAELVKWQNALLAEAYDVAQAQARQRAED